MNNTTKIGGRRAHLSSDAISTTVPKNSPPSSTSAFSSQETSIESLIARSSLGSPGAAAVRAMAPRSVVESAEARLCAAELDTTAPPIDDVAAQLEASKVLDESEQRALEAWNDDSIELSARVLAFAKDQALLDWIDEPEPMIGDARSTGANQQHDGTASQSSSGIVHEVEDVRVSDLSIQSAVPTPEDVYQHFVDGLTEQTRAAYGEDLEHLARYLGQPDSRAAVTHLFRQSSMQANQLVLGWSNAMHAEGYAPSTRSRRMSALRAAVKLANAFGVIDWKLHVRSPKVQKVRDTRGVEPVDVRKMLAACDDSIEGVRDRAIVLLLFGLALRRVEVVRLLLGHYDRVRRRLLVHGKGYQRDPNKVKWRDLPSDVDAALNEWVLRAHNTEALPEVALFYGWQNNHRTEKITPRGVHYLVSKLGERVDVDVWPHSFRHAAATTALKNKQTLHDVQSFMRHEDPATTQIYNDDIDNAPARVAETLMRVLKEDKDI